MLQSSTSLTALDKAGMYAELKAHLEAMLSGERDLIANFANTAALLFQTLPDLNWAGFYLLKKGELVLGPFQGKPACVRIALGRGVCGTAAEQRETLVVPDVHQFPGHIACDAASQSEIVIPLIKSARFIGVMDLDSPIVGRFNQTDVQGLEAICRVVIEGTDLQIDT